MAKMTKTQAKNMLKSISSKANRLWYYESDIMSTVDLIAIDKIVSKYLKKLK